MLQSITRLLEQGCTMLATHHSCGAPLFRCKGQIVCPVCSFGEEGAVEAKEAVKEVPSRASGLGQVGEAHEGAKPSEEAEALVDKAKAGPVSGLAAQKEPGIEEDLRGSVLRKLKNLAEGMEREQDLDKLRKQLDCIEGALRVLRSLER